MVLVHKLVTVASCSICLASAFVGNSPAPAYGKGRVVKVKGVESVAGPRVRPIPPQFNRPASRRRGAVRPLLLSSRTVDVDVIDVTDVTEEEARREKEQVIFFICVCHPVQTSACVNRLYLTRYVVTFQVDAFGRCSRRCVRLRLLRTL